MLTFDKVPSSGVFPMNQIAWRILNYGGPNQSATVNYTANLLFDSLQVNKNKIIQAEAHQTLDVGQQTILNVSGGGILFTKPVKGPPGQITASNNTGDYRDMGVGFLNNEGEVETALVWQNVGNQGIVEAKFTPTLKAYLAMGYQKNEIIEGEITTKVLLTQVVTKLKADTTYVVRKDDTGAYSIKQEELDDDAGN